MCVKDRTKSAVIKFNIKHFICIQTQRFKSPVMSNNSDSVFIDLTMRTSNLAMTLVVTVLNFQGVSDKFYLQVKIMNKNGIHHKFSPSHNFLLGYFTLIL